MLGTEGITQPNISCSSYLTFLVARALATMHRRLARILGLVLSHDLLKEQAPSQGKAPFFKQSILIGSGIGANVCLRFAFRYTKRVEGLLLICPCREASGLWEKGISTATLAAMRTVGLSSDWVLSALTTRYLGSLEPRGGEFTDVVKAHFLSGRLPAVNARKVFYAWSMRPRLDALRLARLGATVGDGFPILILAGTGDAHVDCEM